MFFLEPIGSSKPKFSEDVNSKSITRAVLSQLTLLCPAQGFPLPAFRLDWSLCVISFLIFVEPIGSAKPKFPEDISFKGITRVQNNEVTLLCPAQGYPIPAFRLVQCGYSLWLFLKMFRVDPVGSSKPAFSSAFKSFGLNKVANSAVALVCPGQSYPIPSFRLVFLLKLSHSSNIRQAGRVLSKNDNA